MPLAGAGLNSMHCHIFNSLDLSWLYITLPTAHAGRHSGPLRHPGKMEGMPTIQPNLSNPAPVWCALIAYVLHDLSWNVSHRIKMRRCSKIRESFRLSDRLCIAFNRRKTLPTRRLKLSSVQLKENGSSLVSWGLAPCFILSHGECPQNEPIIKN